MNPAFEPADAFAGWHHSMPFHCLRRGTWIDVHSSVYPPHHPHAQDPLFSWEAIISQLSPVTVGQQTAYVMNHELQLVFTSARWAEEFDPARGLYPILDAALLIGMHRDTLDWDRILGIAGCLYLFISLPMKTQQFFVGAQIIGVILYVIYGSGAAEKARAVKA